MTDLEPSQFDVGAYCREIEAYLCRRNGGHIIRLVGPAFGLVTTWAAQGIPLRVVQQGIDQTVRRHESRATRRRPVRIEFCEADVLAAFDQWRRAIGPAASRAALPAGVSSEETVSARRQPSLARHLERVIERLSSLRAATTLPVGGGQAIDLALQQLDGVLSRARGARKEARQALHEELLQIDEALITGLLNAVAADAGSARDTLMARVETDLRSLRPRLSEDAYRETAQRVLRHLVRGDLGIPELTQP